MKKRIITCVAVSSVILTVALATGSVLLFRLFAISAIVPIMGLLWVSAGARGITGHITVSTERCQAGESFEEEVHLHNNSRLPKFLVRVEANADFPGRRGAAVVNLPARSYRSWHTSASCRRRGRYVLGTATVTVADPFGLFSAGRGFGLPQTVTVYPATVEMPFFSLLSRNQGGGAASRWLVSEIGSSAARVREYAGGDTLNRIHWQSTAHTGTLMVKEFDADHSNLAARNIWIVLDMFRGVQVGEGDDGTEECGVTVAASLIKKYIESGQQVGLIAAGDQTCIAPPEPGTQHVWEMLESLALVKAAGETPIERLIAREGGRFGNGSVVIAITPSSGRNLSAALTEVRRRGVQVIVVALDFAGPRGAGRSAGPAAGLGPGGQMYVVRPGDVPTTMAGEAAVPGRAQAAG